MLKYARIHLFYKFLRPFQQFSRRRRTATFKERIHLHPGQRVIDLGGTPEIWQFVETPLDITLVNIAFNPEMDASIAPQHTFTFAVGDACKLDYPSGSFDLAFSNSVIEHVGDDDRQERFAEEVRRLAPRYWVQTPSKWFPLEAHTGMPFWWFYPQRLRDRLISSWRRKLPEWTEMVETTTVLEKRKLREMFPDSTIANERLLGFVKSYVVYKA